MAYRIRRTRDIDLCRDLHKSIFPDDDFYDAPDAVWWVAYDEQRVPVGFAAVRLLLETQRGAAFLARCGVARAARGNGLQKRFLRLRENYARRSGATWMTTYVDRFNAASGNNLFSSGYILYQPQEDWAGKSYIYFMKKL